MNISTLYEDMIMDKEFELKMIELSKKIDISINDEEIIKFYNYMNLLIEWNEKINLTAITEKNEIILKHFIDSLTILKYIENKGKIVDLGTGAGFPGIPLSIMKNESNFTLADSLNKRINFLNVVKDELQLNNIENIHIRAEEMGQDANYREKFDIATSRAVAGLNVLVEYLLPLVKKGGMAICMKGSQCEEEIEIAKNAIEELGGRIKKVDKISLPEGDIKRNIIIIEKIKSTPNKYPRKSGIPAKKPL